MNSEDGSTKKNRDKKREPCISPMPHEIPSAVIQVDRTGVIIGWNQHAEQLFGWPESSVSGKLLIEIILPLRQRKNNTDFWVHLQKNASTTHSSRPLEYRLTRKDGNEFEAGLSITKIKGSEGDVMNVSISDISPSKYTEEDRILSEVICQSAPEAIIVTNAHQKILFINPAFSRITGYSAKDALGKTPRILQSGRHDSTFYQTMWQHLNKYDTWQGEIWNKRKNGEIFPEWLSIQRVNDHTGEARYFIGFFSDITKRKKIEDKISFQAKHDPLTGLVNRSVIRERLEQALKQENRSHKSTAVLFVDLDKFKAVNDTLGHLFGDLLLKETAKRLLQCVRKTDTVSRSGGDEFLILLTNVSEKKEAAHVAEKILKRLAQPFHLEDQTVFVSGSCGIAVSPDDGESVVTLFKHADLAMYQAKATGRNCFHFFTKKMNRSARSDPVLESELKKVLSDQELVIHYQPAIHLRTHQILSLEPFVRWRHPRHGPLLPEKFFPLAEKSGLISQIDRWVIHTACEQIQRWRTRQQLQCMLSVNISNRQFNDPSFPAFIADTIERFDCPKDLISIEIQENVLTNPNNIALKQLLDLKKKGVKIAIDDFGTGSASLNTLSKYPIDILKIDTSLINKIHLDTRKQLLVQAIIDIGHRFNIKIIAEGINKKAELECLKNLGCDWGQGFYFNKPAPAEAFEATLKLYT